MSYNKETGMYEGFIYLIQNKINGKRYYGQTIRTVEERWYEHKKNSAYNDSCVIHKAFRKYGLENFDFSIVEKHEKTLLNELIDILNNREKYYINAYNTCSHGGYNMTIGGDSGPIESYTKIPIDVYTLDGVLIDECDSGRDACDKYNVSPSQVSSVSLGNVGFAGDYVFRKHGESFDMFEINRIEKYKKPVYQFDRYGNLISIYSSHQDVRNKYNGLIISSIIDNPNRTALGFWWGSTDKFDGFNAFNKTIDQYTVNGKYIKSFDTLVDAAKSVGLNNSSGIQGCCAGRNKTAKGYVWRYSGDEFKGYEDEIKIKSKRNIIIYDIYGKFMQMFDNSKDAAKYIECNQKNIIQCCNGATKSIRGKYVALYEGDNFHYQDNRHIHRIIQCNIDNIVCGIFDTVADAHKKLGNSESCIRKSIKDNSFTKGSRFIRIDLREMKLPEIGDYFDFSK